MVDRLIPVQQCIQFSLMKIVSTATLKARLQLPEPKVKED